MRPSCLGGQPINLDDLARFVGIRWIFHEDYWDGPKSGTIACGDKRFWAVMHSEYYHEPDDPDSDGSVCRVRTFLIYNPPDSFWAAKDAQHAVWRKKVGTHCDYDVFGERKGKVNPDLSQHREYYEAYPTGARVKIQDVAMPIGWFQEN